MTSFIRIGSFTHVLANYGRQCASAGFCGVMMAIGQDSETDMSYVTTRIANFIPVIDDVNGRHSWNIPLNAITVQSMQVN